MPFTKNFRTPAQLTAAARAAYRAHVEQYTTNALLPSENNFTLDYTFGASSELLPAAASFRSFNTESEVGTFDGAASKKGALPPISIRTPVDEYQQLKMYNQPEAIAAAFEKRAIRNAQAVGSRVVLAQAEAIADGKVTIDERGISTVIDFGRNAAQTATAGTPWSTVATATPVGDLEAMRAAMGRSLGRVIVSEQVATYLQRNVDIIKLALGRGSDLPSRISWEDVRTVFRDYRLGEVEVNDEKVVNRAGVEVPIFDAGKVVVLAGSQVGTTQLGVTAEAYESDNGIGQGEAAAGLFSGAMQSDDPVGYNVLVSGIVLPVATATDLTASLSVLGN